MDPIYAKYTRLLEEVVWPWGPTNAKFEIRNDIPQHLIANINIVPYIGTQWVVLQLSDGSYEIPGGTLEAGESYLEALQRELREEAGGIILSFQLIGGWHCYSLAEKPYRPHLPHPESYRAVGVGEIEIIAAPLNPPGGERVVSVIRESLDNVATIFVRSGRLDLAELYQLGAEIK